MDNFHFKSHKKSDKYCQEQCNPNTVMEKLEMSKINSQACEQSFKWLNRFKNMKQMNQARFKFFFLYMVDIHNLHIENKVDSIANPLSKERIKNIMSNRNDSLPNNQAYLHDNQTNKQSTSNLKSKSNFDDNRVSPSCSESQESTESPIIVL